MDPDSCLSFVTDFCRGIVVTPPSVGAVVALVLSVLSLYASAFVSASEIAFFSLTSSELDEIDESDTPCDKRVKTLLDDSERLQATVVVLNNLMNVAFILLLNFFFWNVVHWGAVSAVGFIAVTVVLVFLLLVFGEIMPRIYSAQHALRFCRRSAPVMLRLCAICRPLSNVLVHSTWAFNRLAQKKKPNLSVDELSQALELTDKNDISEESNMLEGIIRFGEETAKEVMTSRLDMVDLEISTPFSKVLRCVVENVYSRIPVYEDTRDNIKGILYIKDLLPYLDKDDSFQWQKLVRPAFFVPETKKIDDLLRDFQANKVHIAIVVDEFGGTLGIVTMEDIIEEIVGEINDEYDEEELPYVKVGDNVYIFEAKTLLSDFYKILKVDADVFEDAAGDSDTVAGLLLELKGEFPALHEVIEFRNYSFEILEMNARRILKVKVTVHPESEQKEEAE